MHAFGTNQAHVPNMANNLLRLHDSILAISDHQREEWDQSIYIANIDGSKSKVNIFLYVMDNKITMMESLHTKSL